MEEQKNDGKPKKKLKSKDVNKKDLLEQPLDQVLGNKDIEIISKGINEYITSPFFSDNISNFINPDMYGLNIPAVSNLFGFVDSNYSKHLEINDQINELKKKLIEKSKEVEAASHDKNVKDKKNQEFSRIIEELRGKEKINHILTRIHVEAQSLLFDDDLFKEKFNDGESSETVVVSIDIRRSTELMLKARTPELFARFITDLSGLLAHVIKTNFGIFDKFTGDGILAFFPKFYSGEEAILRALIAAEQCHKVFNDHYNKSRECFNVFIKDVGLGIGIDYGQVTLVNSGNELTVVGIPVVYACRMSGAPAGHTLLNQPAKEEICIKHDDKIKVIETEISIKNEGNALAYEIELPKGLKILSQPEWLINKDQNKGHVSK